MVDVDVDNVAGLLFFLKDLYNHNLSQKMSKSTQNIIN